jgi:ribonuclease HII
MAQKKQIVFGIDEVERGPLAGPVVAAAITAPQFLIFNFKFLNKKVKDSKKLSAKQRVEVYNFLKNNAEAQWAFGRVGEGVIDKINILQATKLAMVRAVKNLEKKIGQKADRLLIDGNFAIPIARPQQSIVKGDEKVFLIALASIVAKVHRDRLMDNYHKRYPQYGFNQHKGYGTRQHYQALAKHDPCPLHRQTFALSLKSLR